MVVNHYESVTLLSVDGHIVTDLELLRQSKSLLLEAESNYAIG